jgi:MinD-like ATPase involved in chromosome partitioning or flagellar assembly/lipopolysaccharide biosynthesis regulator YciM
MKTITFYSYKGGVGRSLTLSNIAMRLADLGKKVCIIDFDLEAPGLHLKFKKYLTQSKIERGLVEYIDEFQNNSILPSEIKNHIVNLDYKGTLNGSINLLPAGNINNNDYWKRLSSIDWKELFYSEQSNGVSLLLHLKELIKKDYNPDFILIDSRTGITDISGIAMTLLSDSVVTLAANNDENIIGASKVIRSLLQEENNLTGIKPNLYFVLSRIPYYQDSDKKHIEKGIVNRALETINKEGEILKEIFVIHSDRDLEEEEKFKINQKYTFDDESSVPIEEDYLNLFEALTKDDLTNKEIENFNNLRESELLIEEARNTQDSAIKIKLLKKSLELNKNAVDAYWLLSVIYNGLERYEKSIEYSDLAMDIEYSIYYDFVKSDGLKALGKINEAISILEDTLKIHSTFYYSLTALGEIYYEKLNFKKALSYLLRLLEDTSTINDNEKAGVYNSIGSIYKRLGDFDKSFEYIYKSLELEPKKAISTLTLAEIYAELGNDQEFFKNLQLAFVFELTSKDFQKVVNIEEIYKKYYNQTRFIELLKNYRIKVVFPTAS